MMQKDDRGSKGATKVNHRTDAWASQESKGEGKTIQREGAGWKRSAPKGAASFALNELITEWWEDGRRYESQKLHKRELQAQRQQYSPQPTASTPTQGISGGVHLQRQQLRYTQPPHPPMQLQFHPQGQIRQQQPSQQQQQHQQQTREQQGRWRRQQQLKGQRRQEQREGNSSSHQCSSHQDQHQRHSDRLEARPRQPIRNEQHKNVRAPAQEGTPHRHVTTSLRAANERVRRLQRKIACADARAEKETARREATAKAATTANASRKAKKKVERNNKTNDAFAEPQEVGGPKSRKARASNSRTIKALRAEKHTLPMEEAALSR